MASGSSTGPGAIRTAEGTIVLNANRTDAERIELDIVNTGDRPIQIGSHLHLPDANTFAGVRPRSGARVPAGHPVRHVPPVRARRVQRRCRRCLSGRPDDSRYPDQDRRQGPLRPWWRFRAPNMRRCTDRRSATRSGSATPTCGSRSSRTTPQAARRQSSAAASPSASRWRRADHQGAGRAGHRDHQRDRARPLGHRPGRRRDPGRPDRGARPVRQSRRGRRCAPRPADRPVHRRHLRRGQDPHRRRYRLPRAPALALADRRGAGHRADHPRRRRYRARARAPRPPP